MKPKPRTVRVLVLGVALFALVAGAPRFQGAESKTLTNRPPERDDWDAVEVRGTNLPPGAAKLNLMLKEDTNEVRRPDIFDILAPRGQSNEPVRPQPQPDTLDKLHVLKVQAEKGDAEAQFQMGLMYAEGEGVSQDYAEALKWYRKAAEQNHATAQLALGAMYDSGRGVEKDYAEALKWFRKAADQGDVGGQFCLGVMFAKGEGVKKDYVEALKWYRKAADQGNADGQVSLGWMYANGQGVEKDYAEAVKWYRKAAEQGEVSAQRLLGLAYESGRGVGKDMTEAVRWYRKAAELGDAEAQYFLAGAYDFGEGVLQDHSEATRWYRKAADQGDRSSQRALGRLHQEGLGVPQNFVEAYKWYNLAAAQGDTNAVESRRYLLKRMTPEQIAEAQRRSAAFAARKESGPGTGTDLSQDSIPSTPKGTATGFFVTEDGYLVTSFHVVRDATAFKVRTAQGSLAAKLVKGDSANDLAVLKVEGRFAALPVASSRGVKLGDAVATVGFPNPNLQGFMPKLTKGEISSLAGAVDDPRYFQISVAVQPGNSGGALVSAAGNVVGVVAAKLSIKAAIASSGTLPENVNYATKSTYLSGFLESLPDVAARLKEPYPARERNFDEVVKEAQAATVLVLVY